MNITIIGAGYVGLVTGVCFADAGNDVVCVDSDAVRIGNLQRGVMPFYEPGLEKFVSENTNSGRLKFSTDLKNDISAAEFCFIAVGTPSRADGSANLDYIYSAAEEIGDCVQAGIIIVNKATVPVGTVAEITLIIAARIKARGLSFSCPVVANPEFLKEGSAIADCLKPERIIIGTADQVVIDKMRQLYKPFNINHEKIIVMSAVSAEMTKYAANAMLATKISFINEMANICEHLGADINEVRIGIGSDSRIGYSFIYPGVGFGGSCFPKDLRSLIQQSGAHGYAPALLQSVKSVNDEQKLLLVQKICARFGEDLSGMKFAIWGLAFKPQTDDMREAPALDIIRALTECGARVSVYDPKAMQNAQTVYFKDNPAVEYCDNKYLALAEADALLLLTEWREFRSPDFREMSQMLKNKIIYDGRNQYIGYRDILDEEGFEYYCIGCSSNPA